MEGIETYSQKQQDGWLQRLLRMLPGRGGEPEINFTLPTDSLLSGVWAPAGQSVADVPEKVKAQIREEAVHSIFNQLEASLRLLLYATEPGKEPPTAEQFQQILNVWRCELQDRVSLVPDGYCGAVVRYHPEMDAAYTITGRCGTGDLLRVKVPCWRLNGKVVVRGEAERFESEDEQQAPEVTRLRDVYDSEWSVPEVAGESSERW